MPTVDIVSPGGAFTPAAVGDGTTDDAPAFRAFNVWAQTQVSPITLTLGVGAKTFLFNSIDTNNQRGNSPAFNVTQPLTVTGNGSSTSILKSSATAGFFLGGQSSIKSGNGNFGGSSIFTARLNSVSAGSSAVTCKTLSDAALFSANSWALISGLDLMGAFSTPPNPFWFEYVFITNVNTGTGVITFQSALVNTYLDSWPLFSAGTAGLQPDRGGPATLYVLDPQWSIDVTYQSLGIDRTLDGNLTYASGRNVNFTNVKCIGAGGITPSVNGTMTFTNCDLTSYSMEFDKLVGKAVFDATATGQIHFQSANKDVVVQNGSAISSFNGTPRNLTINNSTVGNSTLGATSFGKTDSLVTSGSTFNGSFAFGGVVDSGDNTGVLQTDYTMTNGVIRIQKSGLTYGCRWAIPGAYCFFTGTGNITHGPMFKVLRVVDGGTFFDVFTNWQVGGFPSWATAIQAVPSFSENFAPNTVSSIPDVINLIAATAAGRPHSRTYTSVQRNGGNLGNLGTGNALALPSVSGRLISLTINVVTPYTGAQSSLLWHLAGQFDNLAVVKSDLTTGFYGPIIDLKVGGTRVITPSGVAGSAGSDSGLTLPTPTSWLVELLGAVCASQDIVSEYNASNAVGPVVNITVITDQGFVPDAVAPLRLRLCA